MALEKGKWDITDEKDKENIDNIIRALEATMFAIDSHDELVYEKDYGLDVCVEQ